MKQFRWVLTVLALCSCGTGRADADTIIITSQASFVSNDSAPWVRSFGTSNSYSTSSGLGTFSWNFTAHSTPDNGSTDVVQTTAGILHIGQTAAGTAGTAAYEVNASFAFGGRAVTGFGFFLDQMLPATQLTVYDALGGSQSFTIDNSPGGYLKQGAVSGFVGVESTVPLTKFRLAETVTSSTTTLQVDSVLFNTVPTSTPEPSSILLVLAGCCALGAGVRIRTLVRPARRRERASRREEGEAAGQSEA
jgi:hypothetical protein